MNHPFINLWSIVGCLFVMLIMMSILWTLGAPFGQAILFVLLLLGGAIFFARMGEG